ncbi:MAG: DeoR/GlpR family DNA-binding transcription regulator [Fibrobacterota bacterium]
MRTDRYQEERRVRIVALLADRRRMTVDELARHFNVTGATIRSDLTALMRQNKVIRTLGSAMIVDSAPVSPLAERLQIMSAEKRAIGKKAASLVGPRDIIALDASSTSLAMAPYLRNLDGLTLVTNCLAVAGEFMNHPQVKVLLPGGHLQHESSSIVGRETVEFLKNIRVQTAFIGARSIGLDTGLCDSDPASMAFKQALIKISKKTVALVDSSKWETVSLTTFAGFDQVRTLVTDASIAPENIRGLNKHGVKVLVA